MKKKAKQKKEGFWFDKVKLFTYKWPSVLHTFVKAKRIAKKNKRQPGTFSEEYRYEWTKKRVLKALPLFNVDVQVGGIENWLDRGVVLMPNHQSFFDVLALIAINDFSIQQPLAFIAKKELWESKKLSRFMSLIDTVPLDRNSPRSALEAFKESRDLIVDYKRSLVLFPEGTRETSNQVQEFLPAAMKLPQMANAPIIPVSFINSYEVFEETRSPKKRVIVKVVFGKPILPSKHLQMKTDTLASLVQKEVQKGIDLNIDRELTPLMDLINPKKAAKKKAKAASKNQKKKKKSLFKIV